MLLFVMCFIFVCSFAIQDFTPNSEGGNEVVVKQSLVEEPKTTKTPNPQKTEEQTTKSNLQKATDQELTKSTEFEQNKKRQQNFRQLGLFVLVLLALLLGGWLVKRLLVNPSRLQQMQDIVGVLKEIQAKINKQSLKNNTNNQSYSCAEILEIFTNHNTDQIDVLNNQEFASKARKFVNLQMEWLEMHQIYQEQNNTMIHYYFCIKIINQVLTIPNLDSFLDKNLQGDDLALRPSGQLPITILDLLNVSAAALTNNFKGKRPQLILYEFIKNIQYHTNEQYLLKNFQKNPQNAIIHIMQEYG